MLPMASVFVCMRCICTWLDSAFRATFIVKGSLFTGCHLDDFRAGLALDVATPLELALAALLHLHPLRRVASRAAHLSTAVRT